MKVKTRDHLWIFLYHLVMMQSSNDIKKPPRNVFFSRDKDNWIFLEIAGRMKIES